MASSRGASDVERVHQLRQLSRRGTHSRGDRASRDGGGDARGGNRLEGPVAARDLEDMKHGVHRKDPKDREPVPDSRPHQNGMPLQPASTSGEQTHYDG